MATAIIIDWARSPKKSEHETQYTKIVLDRWAARQQGSVFMSVGNDFILTDLNYENKEINLLKHLLNCNGLAYRAITNIDLSKLGGILWESAINGIGGYSQTKQTNNKKGA